MELNVGKEIAALKRMTVGELRARFRTGFQDSTRSARPDDMDREHIANAGVVAPSEGRSRESYPRTCRDSLLTGETSFSRDDKTGVS